jgi:hypothetical protein
MGRTRRAGVLLVIAAIAGAAVLAGCAPGSRRAAHARQANTPAPVAGLPADWPAQLPVPPGLIQRSNRAPGVWVLAILAQGDATVVRKTLVDLYVAHGFTVEAAAAIPTILTSPAYMISIHMFPRDHSASETDVVLQVSEATPTTPSATG